MCVLLFKHSFQALLLLSGFQVGSTTFVPAMLMR